MMHIWGPGLCLLLLLQVHIEQVSSRKRRSDHISKPFINNKQCPLQPNMASKRKCLKKCHDDSDCKGKNKVCRCDDVCGWSCVKETKRCEELKNIPSGHYSIVPQNIFSARVNYSCDEGYTLVGSQYRVCQGDGYWSESTPACQMVMCEELPSIPHGSYEINPSNILEGRARYDCDEGYMIRGNAERVCQADGTWTGIEPYCETDDRCKDPPKVHHAKNNGIAGQRYYQVGAQLVYQCNLGYKTDGFAKAMCVSDGKWVGPRMTCQPRRCSHPGDIPHATREGSSFVYPRHVTYKCMKGYQLVGRSIRNCQATGEWSGTLPRCIPVKCPKLLSPKNGSRIGPSYTFGAEVTFSCLIGFRLVGSTIRRCLHTGEWSGTDAKCQTVNCGSPGPLPNGMIDSNSNDLTTYGVTLRYKCFTTATIEGESADAICQADGNWSHPPPICWSKCKPPVIKFVKDVEEGWIQHSQPLNFTCQLGFKKATDNPRCYNGTFPVTPKCVPESCRGRPRDIRDGIVRYYSSEHGSKAMYRCNTGYTIMGPKFILCQYGNWTGEPPICEPDYCDYPGQILNGQILLVGVIGKYEYRPYVKKIGHNDQIEYHCNKGYKRLGPIGSTCVAGEWSPSKLPTCKLGQHPKLEYLYRGKRSIQEDTQQSDRCGNPPTVLNAKHDAIAQRDYPVGTQLLYRCDWKYQTVGFAKAICVSDGSWVGPRMTCEKHTFCNHPGTIENGGILLIGVIGKYEYRTYVKNVKHNDQIEYYCKKHYSLVGPSGATCRSGEWMPMNLPYCRPSDTSTSARRKRAANGKNSQLRSHDSHKYDKHYDKDHCKIPSIDNGRYLNLHPGDYVKTGHSVEVMCRPNYTHHPGNSTMSTCIHSYLTVRHSCREKVKPP